MKSFVLSSFVILLVVQVVFSQLVRDGKTAQVEVRSDLKTEPSQRFFDLSSLFNNNKRPYGQNGGYPIGFNPGYYGGGNGGGGYNGYNGNNGGYNGLGTNFIGQGGQGGFGGFGGQGGYGGYGGFGGNGGLPSYYGYNTNDYFGNRNIGYGYYSNTNLNGFPRTYTSPGIISGYRGYN